MPRDDAKRMKPVHSWAIVRRTSGEHMLTYNTRPQLKSHGWEPEIFRIARVEIRELSPKRKRHAT